MSSSMHVPMACNASGCAWLCLVQLLAHQLSGPVPYECCQTRPHGSLFTHQCSAHPLGHSDAQMQQIRRMRIKEIKAELAALNIPTDGIFEKSGLVRPPVPIKLLFCAHLFPGAGGLGDPGVQGALQCVWFRSICRTRD